MTDSDSRCGETKSTLQEIYGSTFCKIDSNRRSTIPKKVSLKPADLETKLASGIVCSQHMILPISQGTAKTEHCQSKIHIVDRD